MKTVLLTNFSIGREVWSRPRYEIAEFITFLKKKTSDYQLYPLADACFYFKY
jgi:hypothetical protein